MDLDKAGLIIRAKSGRAFSCRLDSIEVVSEQGGLDVEKFIRANAEATEEELYRNFCVTTSSLSRLKGTLKGKDDSSFYSRAFFSIKLENIESFALVLDVG